MSINTLPISLPYLISSSTNPYARPGQWLLGTAGLVVGMIHVGGVTRLTQSGLSMTTWSPVGTLPPLNQQEWEAEFARYRQFPEWEQRKNMTLRDFQFIYAWEYGHRMMGRLIGLVYTLPWLYFSVRGKLPPPLPSPGSWTSSLSYQPRLAALGLLGAGQGLVGWWMVKSGLGEDRRGDRQEIRVQPVRLAAHLSVALATYGGLLWTALDMMSWPHTTTSTTTGGANAALATTNTATAATTSAGRLQTMVASIAPKALTTLRRVRMGAGLLTGLTAVTIASGALVAGNDAGKAYNTWPRMSDDAYFVVSEAWPANLSVFTAATKDTATTQGNHRLLATGTALTGLAVVGGAAALAPAAALTPQVRQGLAAVGVTVLGQYTLGVVTLLNYVPISLAAAHQVGSLAVFSSGLYLTHALRYASRRLVR